MSAGDNAESIVQAVSFPITLTFRYPHLILTYSLVAHLASSMMHHGCTRRVSS